MSGCSPFRVDFFRLYNSELSSSNLFCETLWNSLGPSRKVACVSPTRAHGNLGQLNIRIEPILQKERQHAEAN